MQAEAKVTELTLLNGSSSARILCPPKMIPAPGQYLLAYADGSDAPLAASVFVARVFADGFLAAPPVPSTWIPGTCLNLRGPLGHGFNLPVSARRVALIAFDDSPARLLPLLDLALKQGSSIALVCETPPDDLPLQVEVQPLRALSDVYHWADYVALDAARESLPGLRESFGLRSPLAARNEAQILVRTPMPCGALAQCGVCAIEARHGHLLTCDNGPVFDLKDLFQ
jgi:hypothetical protein